MSFVLDDLKTVPARERQGALRAVMDLKKPRTVAPRARYGRKPPRLRSDDCTNLVAYSGTRKCRGQDLQEFAVALERIGMIPEHLVYKVGDGINLILDVSNFEIKVRDETVRLLHFTVTKVTIQEHAHVIAPEGEVPLLHLSMTENMYAPSELLEAIREAYGVN